jgi:hypothetical protein
VHPVTQFHGHAEEIVKWTDARVVHQNVQGVKTVENGVHHAVNIVLQSYIGLHSKSVTTKLFDFSYDISRRIPSLAVVDHHVGASAGQSETDPSPDSPRSTRNKRNFALKIHNRPTLR